MATLNEKIEHALDENRILILGAEVLLGFQFQAFFLEAFDSTPGYSRTLMLVGLFFLLITVVLLIAPVAYHQIVCSGEDTADMHAYVTLLTGSSLLPFGLGLATGFFVAGERLGGPKVGMAAAGATLGTALFFWYGVALVARQRNNKGRTSLKSRHEQHDATELDKKIKRALTETRIVLPGAQALLGFQFAIIMMPPFETLSEWLQTLHMASLASVGLSTILLMAPAAYHRIAESGEDSERLHRFMRVILLSAMVFLGLGISGDAVVVVGKVTGSLMLALACGLAVLLLSLGLWFGFSLYRRRKLQVQRA